MAKTRSPLFSSSAHGKLARSLIYSKKKSGQLTRAMHYPKKEPSLDQWTHRHVLGLATARWQCMTDDEHITWNADAAALGLNIPGYHYFIKATLADQATHSGMLLYLPLNESTGDKVYCHACDMIAGDLKPSYPDDCPTRVSSFRTEYGNALDFSAEGVYANIDAMPKLSFTDLITLECWFKQKDLSDGISTFLRNWNHAVDDRVFNFYLNNRRPEMAFSSDGIETVTHRWNVYQDTEWKHIVVTLSADHLFRCYINAEQLDGTHELTSFHDASNDISLGGAGGAENFNGILDEVLIYNRALGPAEIKKHYQLLRLDKKRQPLLRL